MHARRLAVVVAVILTLLVTPIAVHAAWVSLSPIPPHAAAPSRGHFSWGQSPSTSTVVWTQNMIWNDPQWTELRKQTIYRLEVEGYRPAGGGTNCDRLHAVAAYASLPLDALPSIANGCGGSSVREEVTFRIKELAVERGTAYYTQVTYDKVGSGSVTHWEVNWSFGNLLWDYWLAKIGYNIVVSGPYNDYRPWCSSPATILTGHGGCP